MELADAVAALEQAGTEQNRKIYARHGAREPMYGVSYKTLNALAKKAGTDASLAQELWGTGNHDARALAMKVADPSVVTVGVANAWMRDCTDAILGEAVADVVARSPVAQGRADVWRDRKGEWPSAIGWSVTAGIALAGGYSAREAQDLVTVIRDTIHERPNRTRYEMNQALIALGVMSPGLHRRAVAAAERIGTVEVDHGETSCKTPDAIEYMDRMLARRAQ